MMVDQQTTQSVLEKYSNSINWISERDGGQAAAVNKGLRRAKGTYIAWINSDDILYAGALEIVSKVFEEHPEVDIVYGKARHIDINGSTIEHYPTQEWDAKLLDKVCYLCQPAVFIRRKVLARAGYLNEELRYCMDYEYWLRLRDLGKIGRAHV